MKILLSWLKEYIALDDTEGLPELLTRAGIEVDYTEILKPLFTGVVAARVVKVSRHATSPNLACATVFDGQKEHTVVCSATNCHEGMLTAYAPIGSMVQDKKIEATNFGNSVSEGMLCSEHELGLSSFHDGIMQLPNTLAEGTPLQTYFFDIMYEVSVTPNLGHCQSVMGVARELAAFLGKPLLQKPWSESPAIQALSSSKISVLVQDETLAPRYSALLLEGIKVGPSPSLIRIRLERTGHRSINNIVDTTNYISHDIGQPLHAFDSDRVHNGALIIRASKPNESLTLLDEVTHKLPEGAIVIADTQQILAVGGIMGGENSAVSHTTTRIILESAHFSPSAIRKARTKLSLCTDCAKRFERGTDSGITLKALEMAVKMIQTTCPNAKIEAVIDVQKTHVEKQVSCRLRRASMLLGYEVSANEAESAFQRLGLPATFDAQDTYTVRVPTFRHDISEEVDLIEEIGRLVGLQREVATPARYVSSPLAHHPMYLFDGELRRRLLSFGLQEIVTSDLISPVMASLVNVADDMLVKMTNPLSSDQSILRPSLLPGFFDVVSRNLNQRILDMCLFEVGHAHLKKGKTFVEPKLFSLALTGKNKETNKAWDFFDLKGLLEELFSTLRFSNVTTEKSNLPMLHPGRQAKILVDGVHVGMLGEIHPELLDTFGISQRVYYAECDMQELIQLSRAVVKMRALPIFPASDRDWTITLSKKIPYAAIVQKINEVKPVICEDVSLVSLFEHEKLGADKHNVTLHFVYRDTAKTVSQEEVDAAHQKLVSQVVHYLAEKYPE
ncbi:MAG: phenylalanine--tRNA ligase subunit beta [Chlamydiales bacterium]|nr:phenylalanine--tRNA ligase subunit beta [Chlamydiales bacterium]